MDCKHYTGQTHGTCILIKLFQVYHKEQQKAADWECKVGHSMPSSLATWLPCAEDQ